MPTAAIPRGDPIEALPTVPTVVACYSVFDHFFPALGFTDLTDGVYDGDPARPYTPGGLGKIVQAILTRAGCWWRGLGAAHRFRRSFATEYLRENREDLVGLQRLMRHKQVSTTARYCFLQPADLAPRLSRVTL